MNTNMFILSLLAFMAGLFSAVSAFPVGDMVVETRITPVYHLTSVAPKPQQFTNSSSSAINAVPQAPPESAVSSSPAAAPPASAAPAAPADDAGIRPPTPPPQSTQPVYVAEYHPPSGPAPPGAPPASSAGDTSSSSSSGFDSSPASSSSSTKCRPDEPSIRVNNTSPQAICYMVEMSASIGPGSSSLINVTDTACGPGSGINVPPRRDIEFCPGAGFVGAITAFRDGYQRGSRVEFNFATSANETFYDVDYEMGIDSCTVGPRSGRPRVLDGGARKEPSLAGEKDCVGRVNEAFQRLDAGRKVELLQETAAEKWLGMDGEGNVGRVGVDKSAPAGFVRWLQLEVGLKGYVSSGSVAGEGVDGLEAEVRRVADGFTWSVQERQMVLTAY